MNNSERLNIWIAHRDNAQRSLNSVRDRFPSIGAAMQSQIRAGWKAQLKTANGFVDFYNDKLTPKA
jgi:hypothetical protein